MVGDQYRRKRPAAHEPTLIYLNSPTMSQQDEMARQMAETALNELAKHEKSCDLRYQRMESGIDKIADRMWQIVIAVALGAVATVAAVILSQIGL